LIRIPNNLNALSITIICTIILLCLSVVNCQRRSMTVKNIEQLIRKEIPIGSSVSQVIVFLDSHNISHSQVFTVPPYGTNDDVIQKKPDTIKGYMNASIKEVRRDLLASFGIYMKFYFDERGSLVDYTVREVGTAF
jgi:hypothetical protein